jgi:hypothetical protein
MNIKSKRFWLNFLTAITMTGAMVANYQMSTQTAQIVLVVVSVANIVLQTWFNQDISGS